MYSTYIRLNLIFIINMNFYIRCDYKEWTP